MSRRRRLKVGPVLVRTMSTCGCGKKQCGTREDARAARRAAAYSTGPGGHNEVRYYQCSYGYWHWTSRVGGVA